MRTICFEDASDNLVAVIDQVIADAEAILITRQDSPNAEIVFQAQYRSIMERYTCCARQPMLHHWLALLSGTGEAREGPLGTHK
ncbi:type II toxin-antitoxin system Phd/YefM family antitoxin [Ralstonia pseudosolanacearum]